jgi:hypothetical protein
MSGMYNGRGNNAGPATEFFPLSGATASSPSILITATSAAGQTTIHTADPNAQDVVFLSYSNVSSAALTVYTNLGSTATTGNIQTELESAAWNVASNGNFSISKSGVVGAWTTATTGIYAYGYVARTYTATG